MIQGVLCQAVAYRDSSWNPLGPNSQKTLYYHHDGIALYRVNATSGAQTVLYRLIHLPGDTVAVPDFWSVFGVNVFGVVLDTFSVVRMDSSWFAYSIAWTCTSGQDTFRDTSIVIPGFGWMPAFSIGQPLECLPVCLPLDGTNYSLSCAYVPGLGYDGNADLCQDLVSLHPPAAGEVSLSLFPNPASSWIQVSGCNDQLPRRYQIITSLGKPVTDILPYPEQGFIRVDNLPAGLYHLFIIADPAAVLWTGRFVRSE